MRILMAAFATAMMAVGTAGAADLDDGKEGYTGPPKRMCEAHVTALVPCEKGSSKMCSAQVAGKVPCDSITKVEKAEKIVTYEPVHKVEKVVAKDGQVCIRRCLSDRAWELCETKSWFANMKGHPNAKPNGDRATKYATERFFEQCGIDCRPRGTLRIGYQSPYTKEWTVFRYGHPED
jgi:hypothetical protein